MAVDRYTGKDVPCGACHLCCRMMTPLHPERGDDVTSYQTATLLAPGKPPMLILDRLPNGDCFYLASDGCTIHDRAPAACKKYDCRQMFRDSDRSGRKLAVKEGRVPKGIFERGRELIEAE